MCERKNLKTQRRNIAGGEKGAKCRRLRSFDLIHNFAVFRGETGLVTLSLSLPSLFFSQSQRIGARKMWKSRAIHPASGDDAVYTGVELYHWPYRQIPSSFTRNDSYIVSAGMAQSGSPSVAAGSERRNTSFIHIVVFIRNLIFSRSMCTLPQECISNFARYRVYYSLQLRSK